MPKLQELRKQIKITLPKSGAIVKIWDSFSALDVERISRFTAKFDDPGIVYPISLIIVEWDFTDENDARVKITKEAVEKLHMEDLYTILKEAKIDQDFLEEGGQEKKSPSGSERK